MASWRDRLRPGVFTAPDGKDHKIVGTAFSRSRNLRGKAWEYADVDGAYVQRRGNGPKTYPLRVLFSGRNCDLEATAFEDAVSLPGFGTLTHPAYPTVPTVAALGEVSRREDLVERGGEVVVEVTFIDSLESVFPLAAIDPELNAIDSIEAFNSAAAEDFAESAELTQLDAVAMTKATIQSALTAYKRTIAQASRFVQAAQDDFNANYRAVQNSIDVLMGAPTDLALQTCQLIQSPSRATRALTDRVEGYLGTLIGALGQFMGSVFASSDEPSITFEQEGNDFAVQDLVAQATLSSMLIASINMQYPTRAKALGAVVSLIDQIDALTDWRDKRAEQLFAARGLKALDVGRGYSALHRSSTLTLGTLVSVGFALRTERKIVLGRPRQLVELCAELYGSVENAALNKLINDNDLTGSQILELAPGTEIAYSL